MIFIFIVKKAITLYGKENRALFCNLSKLTAFVDKLKVGFNFEKLYYPL